MAQVSWNGTASGNSVVGDTCNKGLLALSHFGPGCSSAREASVAQACPRPPAQVGPQNPLCSVGCRLPSSVGRRFGNKCERHRIARPLLASVVGSSRIIPSRKRAPKTMGALFQASIASSCSLPNACNPASSDPAGARGSTRKFQTKACPNNQT